MTITQNGGLLEQAAHKMNLDKKTDIIGLEETTANL
jgi:hypothetical protein